MTKTKVSFNLDGDLLHEIDRLMKKPPRKSQTEVLNQLISDGLRAEELLAQARRREDYTLLKLLFIMRYLASSRGPGTLEEIDRRFEDELPALRETIFQEGMDYAGR